MRRCWRSARNGVTGGGVSLCIDTALRPLWQPFGAEIVEKSRGALNTASLGGKSGVVAAGSGRWGIIVGALGVRRGITLPVSPGPTKSHITV